MCGIVGFVDKKGLLAEPEKRAVLTEMLATIRHRGPDGSGLEIFNWGGMAHARLSIIDLTDAGRQPMYDAQNSLVISFNGEIYNHESFKKDLIGTYAFRSRTDTESLLYAYKEWGAACLERLKGMFAFSLYDQSQQRLVLAVDRFGIKPLYYIDTPEWFAWSSEAKAFQALPGFEMRLDASVLGEQILFRFIAGQKTLMRNVRKMLPGTMLTFLLDRYGMDIQTYWQARKDSFSFKTSAHAGELQKLLETSVSEHLLADVPIGIQLSGGLDSSLVAALVRSKMRGQELHSFSIGFADDGWNEFPYSRIVADNLETVHHELIMTEDDFCRALPVATFYHDEPINHSHSIPMMLLAAEAKKYVKVLMSGEGADELFGGYRRYQRLRSLPLSDEILLFSNAFSSEEEMQRILFEPREVLSDRRQVLGRDSDSSEQFRIAAYDIATYLPGLLLRQDKMGMRSGLENRVPFLDHTLAAAALALPDKERLRGGEGKVILKHIARQFLPEEIINRKKVGFAQPIAAWLRNRQGLGAYLELLSDSVLAEHVKQEEVAFVIDEHLSGVQDHAALLWTLIALEVWARIFIEGQSADSMWESLSR